MTTVTGKVKITNLPADFAITDVTSLVQFLQKNQTVEFDASEVTNLVISDQAPDPTAGRVVWWRLDAAGKFLGLFTYLNSQWVQAFPHPQGIFRMYGDSRNVPTGYTLVSNSIPGITTAMANAIQATWLFDPTNTYYVIFDVVYIGV